MPKKIAQEAYILPIGDDGYGPTSNTRSLVKKRKAQAEKEGIELLQGAAYLPASLVAHIAALLSTAYDIKI